MPNGKKLNKTLRDQAKTRDLDSTKLHCNRKCENLTFVFVFVCIWPDTSTISNFLCLSPILFNNIRLVHSIFGVANSVRLCEIKAKIRGIR